jgi:CRP-like cAMP-binding protein
MRRPTGNGKLESCEACMTRLKGVFACVSAPALADLDHAKVTHHYGRGHVLHYEGNPVATVVCIRSGRVKVHSCTPRDRPHILYLAGPGDVLGVESALTGRHHASTAEMIEDGSVCHIDRGTFLRTLDQSPAALRSVTKLLAEQLLRSEAERAELAGGSVGERMALTLLSLARKYGEPTENGIRIGLTLSRDDIAEMVGTTPETAIRQLSELRREGIIATRGRVILIEHPTRLARLARIQERFVL